MDNDVLRELVLSAVHVFVMGEEDAIRYKFTRLDSPNILPGEQVVVTIKREHKWTEVEAPVQIVFEGVSV